MPAPDPHAIILAEIGHGRITVTFENFVLGNRKARFARAKAILRNLRRDDWLCRWCRDPVPLYKRADARFCCEGCRKRSARQRRKWLEDGWELRREI